MQRRTFVIAAVAGGIGLVEYAVVNGWMNGLANPVSVSAKQWEQYGAKAALMAITPNADFYVTSKGGTPKIDASRWQLKVDGLVEHPFSLSYQDLLALPAIEKELTLECISNSIRGRAIGNARWIGTPLKPLLERARPTAEAHYAVIHAAEGFSSGHPLERMWNEHNFLAYRMNGETLSPVHGYPARVFIPGKFGMKQPKWITRIEFVNEHYLGYWESKGWSDDCERWAHARFTDLKDGATISGRNFELTGYAIGNLDGIRTVEISFDGGVSWQPADLYSNPSPLTWSFWKYLWVSPKPGAYGLRLRTIDGKGRVEGWTPRDNFPDGATGQEEIKITVA